MEIKTTYHDLCLEISILELRLDELKNEMAVYHGSLFTGELPSCNHAHIPLDNAIKRYNKVCDKIGEVNELLKSKQHTRKEIEKRMSQFEGLEYKVVYYRDVEHWSLKEIAIKLGYTPEYIRAISARIPRTKTA